MSEKCELRERLNMTLRYARKLEHDLERMEVLMAKATRANAPMEGDKVKTSVTNMHDVIVAAIADLDTQIEAERDYLDYLREGNKLFFEESDLDKDELEVMMRRYVDCLEWDKIAEILYWSKRHVQRLHGTALLKLVTRWHTLAHDVTRFL